MQYTSLNETSPRFDFPEGDPTHRERIVKALKDYFDRGLTAFPVDIKLIGEDGVWKKIAKKFSFRWREETITREKALEKAKQEQWNATALLTGKKHNLFVVDIDVKNQRNGHEFLERKGIVIPEDTPRVKTQSGGMHYYFAFPENLSGKSTRAFEKHGIDIRGDRGLVFAPFTDLGGGHRYTWEVGLEKGLKAPPEELLRCLGLIENQEAKSSAKQQVNRGLTLSGVSPKQQEVFSRLLKTADTLPVGERSEADFAVVAWGIKIGLSEQEIFNQVKNIGKFAEKDNQGHLQAYFDTTYQNARQAVESDPNWRPPELKKIQKEIIEDTVKKLLSEKNKKGLFDLAPELAELNETEYGKIRLDIKETLGTQFPITKLDKAVDEQKEVLKTSQTQKTQKLDILKVLEDSQNIIKLYPAQDYKDGKMWYSTETKEGILIINSQKEHFFLRELQENSRYKLLSKPVTFNLSPATVSEFLQNTQSLENGYSEGRFLALKLFKHTREYLSRFYYFRNPYQPDILALWIMGSYIFTVFRYFPYLHFKAEKRSGKSFLMDVMQKIVFNGEMVSNITEASLFRDIQCNRTSLFLDEVERFRTKDKDIYGQLISILNTGFYYNGNTKRTEKVKDEFMVKNYSTYSPKVLAGINELDDVLQDRTILIRLWRKKGEEKVQRFKLNNDLETEIQQLKHHCFIFGLKYGPAIFDYYNRLDNFDIMPDNLNDRERDIYEPLFAIAQVIQSEVELNNESLNLLKNLQNFASEGAADRKEDDSEKNQTSKVVNFISEIIEEGKITPLDEKDKGEYFCRDEIYQVFMREYQKDYFPWIDTSTKLVRLISRKLNLKPKNHLRRPGKKEYLISKEELIDLKQRLL
jgi:hypothetical protein